MTFTSSADRKPHGLPTAAPTQAEKRHILIVDDEPNMLHTLEFILEAADYSVTTTADGQDALERILASRENSSPIDLLITDIRMPGLTGLQLVDELNHLDLKMPILVITAYGNQALPIKLTAAGCADCLDKPFNHDELIRRVDLLFENQ